MHPEAKSLGLIFSNILMIHFDPQKCLNDYFGPQKYRNDPFRPSKMPYISYVIRKKNFSPTS